MAAIKTNSERNRTPRGGNLDLCMYFPQALKNYVPCSNCCWRGKVFLGFPRREVRALA
jgi:hypothetical protein